MAGRLAGRSGLITGAGSGIGRATALVMAREGAKVVVADVDTAGGAETVAQIEAAGGTARFVACDVTDADACEALVAETVAAFGRLDWAFNNAGIAGPAAPTGDYSVKGWHRVLDINLNGVWYGMRAQLQQMVAQGGAGAIVNTASIAGLVGIRGGAAYIAAKHGVVGLTKVSALEYAKQGIRVNAVCPGYTRTPIMDPGLAKRPDLIDRFAERTPLGRVGQPREIGEAVAWLCSDDASFVTGVALPVDGGVMAA